MIQSLQSTGTSTPDLAGLRIRTRQIPDAGDCRYLRGLVRNHKTPRVEVAVSVLQKVNDALKLIPDLFVALQGLQDEIHEKERTKMALWSVVGAEVGDPDYGDIAVGYLAEKAAADLTRTRQELDEAETETQRIADCWQAAHERAEALQATLTRLQAGGYVQHLLGCPHKHRGDNDAGCTCGLGSLQVPEPTAVARPPRERHS